MSFVVALPEPITLSVRQRLLAVVLARIALWAVHGRRPDRRVQRVLGLVLRRPCRASSPVEAEQAVRAVTTAVLQLGGSTACLPRSLAALLLCRVHGHVPALVVGIRPATGEVHAWIDAAGRAVAEPSDPRPAYVPVKTYPSGDQR